MPHPSRPDGVKLHDTPWRRCGTDACTSVAAAKDSIRDRLHLVKWANEMNHLVDYYERVTTPIAPTAK